VIEKDILFLIFCTVTNQMSVLNHVTRSLKLKKHPRNTETLWNSFSTFYSN